jgi:VanZ family protein
MIKKNIFSIITALAILFLSFANPEDLNVISPVFFEGMDKVAHFVMYFAFTMVILLENRRNITKIKRLIMFSIIPLVFGAVIEILQSFLTATRSGSIYDLLFNLAGIVVSIILYNYFRPPIKENNQN